MLGVNYTDVVSTDLDERVQSLEGIKYQLEQVIDAVKTGENIDDYDSLITQCENWIDECERDISSVQDEIDAQLKHAPRYGHSSCME